MFNRNFSSQIPLPQNIQPSQINQQQTPILPIQNSTYQQDTLTSVNYQNTQPTHYTQPIQSTQSVQPVQSQNEKNDDFLDKNELFEFLNTKFNKIDEALINYRQEKSQSIQKQPEINETKEKLKKNKKVYANIDDSLYNKVKEKYPNFPDEKKENLVIDNDGNFYIDKKKKKIPLNNVNALKLINKK
jgi:hypothetical protein